jgi:hypothetical protein
VVSPCPERRNRGDKGQFLWLLHGFAEAAGWEGTFRLRDRFTKWRILWVEAAGWLLEWGRWGPRQRGTNLIMKPRRQIVEHILFFIRHPYIWDYVHITSRVLQRDPLK